MHKFFAKTEYLGKKVLILPQCHSTNDEAQKLLKSKDFINGATVITDHQLNGKGQRGNSWVSEPGKNALFSLILETHFISMKKPFDLHMIISLALYDTLFPILGKNLKIKWPNDLYYKSSKLAGILIENTISKGQFENSVIGVGINVNQDKFHLENASSLLEITQNEHAINEIIENFLINLERRIATFDTEKSDALKNEYERKLYLIGKTRVFKDSEGQFVGELIGVHDSGKLKIHNGNKLHLYDIKEISYV